MLNLAFGPKSSPTTPHQTMFQMMYNTWEVDALVSGLSSEMTGDEYLAALGEELW